MEQKLYNLLKKSWTVDSCMTSKKENWEEENPAVGQDDVSSLVVNDFLGGNIYMCVVNDEEHYYNIIDGKLVDTTIEQFNGMIPNYNGTEVTKESMLSNPDTDLRYHTLLKNYKESISLEMFRLKATKK